MDAYRQVRIETYDTDLGQTSWVTTEESNEIPKLLALKPNSFVLEIGCGSGGSTDFLEHVPMYRHFLTDVEAALPNPYA